MDFFRQLFRRRSSAHLCVVIRSSPDWSNLSQREFEEQSREFCRRVNRPEEQVVETARLWDATFRTTYCQTRQAMKEIAQETLRRLAPAEILQGEPPGLRPGALYLLTDDDDWFSPALPAALAGLPVGKTGEEYDGVTWGNVMLGPWRKGAEEPILSEPEPVHLRPLTVTCHSNNYALTAGYLQRTKKAWKKVFSHGHADEMFRTLRIFNVERYLSVKNTNPASTVFLENGLQREFSSRRLRELIEQYNARFARGEASLANPDLRWARPGIAAVRRFFVELAAGAR